MWVLNPIFLALFLVVVVEQQKRMKSGSILKPTEIFSWASKSAKEHVSIRRKERPKVAVGTALTGTVFIAAPPQF